MTSPAFSDWLDICNLKARYCRCLDTKDWQGYAEVFADDAVLDTSPSGGLTVAGRDALVAYVRSSISEDTITTHHIHAPEIAIDGDTATGIWRCRIATSGQTGASFWALAIITNAMFAQQTGGGLPRAV